MSKKIKIKEKKPKFKVIEKEHPEESELEEKIDESTSVPIPIHFQKGSSPEELKLPVQGSTRVTAQTAESVDSNSSRNVSYQSSAVNERRTYSTAIRQEANENAMALSSPEQAQIPRNNMFGQKSSNLFAEKNRLELERQALQNEEDQRRQYEQQEKERRKKHPGAYG